MTMGRQENDLRLWDTAFGYNRFTQEIKKILFEIVMVYFC
jgi:hypothetical protein